MKTSLLAATFAICAFALAGPIAALAQSQDPLIGTWNITGANSFIAVMTFNQGGTTVEFDTAGTNSSASSGESIDLGKWVATAQPLNYTFNEENYIYDSSGNLSLIAIANCKLSPVL